MLETRLVVDGQQRLTTVQLLLKAVQGVFEEVAANNAAMRLEVLVENPAAYRDNNPDATFKVWPTTADQATFRGAMSGDQVDQQQESEPIVRAKKFFKDQVVDWLGKLSSDVGKRAEALERAVRNHLELVVIDLGPKDDPHVIFETLNARGTPLLQSDLIKNMILYEAGTACAPYASDDPERLWDFSDGWWRQEVRQGRLLRPRIDVFLNHWLVMRKRDEVAASDVFSEFRRYYEEGCGEIGEVATDIESVSKTYRDLEQHRMPSIETFIYRWRVMQAGVITPVLLWLLTSTVPPQQVSKGIRALESYLVRRMVCRMSSQDYNRLMIRMVERLEVEGPTKAGDTVIDFLREQTAYARIWPRDQDFKGAFLQKPLFRLLTRSRLRMLLEGIEDHLRTDRAESSQCPQNLTIEHILPRRWRQHWPLPRDVEDKTEAEEVRDYQKHCLGNLTLVNKRLNPALSNAPWMQKRATLDEHTTLFLNKELLKNAPAVWDEGAMEERAKRLYEMATQVWPHADCI